MFWLVWNEVVLEADNRVSRTTGLGKYSSIFLTTRWFIWNKLEVLFKALKEKVFFLSSLFLCLIYLWKCHLWHSYPSAWLVRMARNLTIVAPREFSGSWSCKWAYITWMPFVLQLNRMILILVLFNKPVRTISFSSPSLLEVCFCVLTRKTLFQKKN